MTSKLQRRAQKRLREIQTQRLDPRYLRALSGFVRAGLLSSNQPLSQRKARATLADVLFAGTVEPRFFELLPAVMLKRPSLLRRPKKLPVDLEATMNAMRLGTPGPDFRGAAFAACAQWLPRIGHRNKLPTVVKSFRFRRDDLDRFRRIRERFVDASDSDILRMALLALEQTSEDPTVQ